MIWIAFGILLVVLIIRGRYDATKSAFASLAILAAAFAGIVLYILGNHVVAAITIPEYQVSEKIEIVSLDTSTLASGRFTLGIGSVQQEYHYFYYERVPLGGYQLKSVSADKATIIEVQQKAGILEKLIPTLWSLIWSIEYPERVNIYIPEGSIIRKFNPNTGGGE